MIVKIIIVFIHSWLVSMVTNESESHFLHHDIWLLWTFFVAYNSDNFLNQFCSIILYYYCDQPSSFSQAPSACGVQCSTERLVSALWTNPLPDRSNYTPLLPHPLPHSGNASILSVCARPFTKPLRWKLILHWCSALLQNLVGSSGEMQCLEEADQQAEASVDVP